MIKLYRTKFLILVLFSTSAFVGYAQKEGNIWTFPDRASINFNDTSNIIVDTSAIGAGTGFPLSNQTSISESTGALFCYAAGIDFSYHGLYIFDKTHHVMPNGGNLQGHPIYSSLLLPYPGIDSLIYLFHIGRDSVSTNYFRLFFSLINKNSNNGLGDVVIRDSIIRYGTLSWLKIAACKHANGRDWWLFIRGYGDDAFYYYLLDPTGITNMGAQNIGDSAVSGFGKLIFSEDGTKLMNAAVNGIIDVFDFDRCTGLLSNYRDIGEHFISNAYQYFNAAFSPNGNLIYVSPWNIAKVFYQWNLNAGDINAIRSSKTLLNEYPDTGEVVSYTYFGHNLSPDGKIYIPMANNYFSGGSTNVTHYLDVIEYPDSVGLACHYLRQGFSLNGRRGCGYLPNLPYYGLGADIGSVCDSLPPIGINEEFKETSSIEVFPNPSIGMFSLRLKDLNDKITSLQIKDILGKEILSIKNLSSTVDISNQSSGIYFVHAITQKKINYVLKVIKW